MTKASAQQQSWPHLVKHWDRLQNELDGLPKDQAGLNRQAEISQELADLQRQMGEIVEAGRAGRTAPVDSLNLAVLRPNR